MALSTKIINLVSKRLPYSRSFSVISPDMFKSPPISKLTVNTKIDETKPEFINSLKSVSSSLFDIPESNFKKSKFQIVKGGITNKLYRFIENDKSSWLFRVYGENTEALIDRDGNISHNINYLAEDQLSFLLGEAGQGVKILGYFKNGRIEQWLDGMRPLKPQEMLEPEISAKIAKEMKKLHDLEITGDKLPPKEVTLWKKLDQWCNEAEGVIFNDKQKQERFKKLNKEAKELKEQLPKSPTVFAHNDLLSGNVMFNPKNGNLCFIDFEYGGYNPRGFDIANHFAECCGFECEWDNYPNKKQQNIFFSSYLNTKDNKMIEELFKEVDPNFITSHLWWGVWGIIQAKNSKIDFDFLGYAENRLGAFRDAKMRNDHGL